MGKTIDEFLLKVGNKLIFYYVATVILFLIFGAPDMTRLLDKILMIVGITIGIFFFPTFLRLYYNFQAPKINKRNNRFIKIFKFQLYFFQTFGFMIIFMGMSSALSGVSYIPFGLLVVNIGLSILLEIAKLREKYFSEI